jgi:hypothetical protein
MVIEFDTGGIGPKEKYHQNQDSRLHKWPVVCFCPKMCSLWVFALVILFFLLVGTVVYRPCCRSARFCPKILAVAEGAVSARFREEHFVLCVNFRFWKDRIGLPWTALMSAKGKNIVRIRKKTRFVQTMTTLNRLWWRVSRETSGIYPGSEIRDRSYKWLSLATTMEKPICKLLPPDLSFCAIITIIHEFGSES